MRLYFKNVAIVFLYSPGKVLSLGVKTFILSQTFSAKESATGSLNNKFFLFTRPKKSNRHSMNAFVKRRI